MDGKRAADGVNRNALPESVRDEESSQPQNIFVYCTEFLRYLLFVGGGGGGAAALYSNSSAFVFGGHL